MTAPSGAMGGAVAIIIGVAASGLLRTQEAPASPAVLALGDSVFHGKAGGALCYVCHAEAPFVDTSQDPRLDTRFPLHGTHTAAIASFSGPVGGTVDEDGAGRGNALCAECHFRTHGTTYAVNGQEPERRLVNFAPNVQPYGGSNPSYQGILDYDDAAGTCTLTCHGVDHGGWSY